MTADKKIWLFMTSPLANYTNKSLLDNPVCLVIQEKYSMKEVKEQLLSLLRLNSMEYILKVRNHRNSLIPFNGKIPENTETNPYNLEIIPLHYNVKPIVRYEKRKEESERIRRKMEEISSRMEKLEQVLPDYKRKQKERVASEMERMDTQVDFLLDRLGKAKSASWQGVVKRSPLW